MVHPDHQKKGVGRKLLTSVLDKCDAEGLPAFLQSSEAAHPLYLQSGFRDLGEWTLPSVYFAKEIVRIEEELGIKTAEGLVESSQKPEEEAIMVRWGKSQQI